MKIRLGFVSNSSSSSYVVVVAKEEFDALYARMNALEKDVMTWLMKECQSDTPFLGNQVVFFSWESGNYNTMENYDFGDGGTGYKEGDIADEDEMAIIHDTPWRFKCNVQKLSPEKARIFETNC